MYLVTLIILKHKYGIYIYYIKILDAKHCVIISKNKKNNHVTGIGNRENIFIPLIRNRTKMIG